jgi:hypothetical protein
MALIRPSSVPRPVATTTPAPCPAVTSVPENAIDVQSPSGASAGTDSGVFSTGRESPVSAAS